MLCLAGLCICLLVLFGLVCGFVSRHLIVCWLLFALFVLFLVGVFCISAIAYVLLFNCVCFIALESGLCYVIYVLALWLTVGIGV